MVPCLNRQRRLVIIRICRHLVGLGLAVGLFHLGDHDLQEWLIPFLFLSGVLVGLVAGRPFGWLVAAYCLWGWTMVELVHDYFIVGPFYGWNLGEVLIHQEGERAIIVSYFSAILIGGGLVGWCMNLAAARLHIRCRRS